MQVLRQRESPPKILTPPVNYFAGSLTTATVDVILPAGAYALIFGAGRFGASALGWGAMANIGSSPYVFNSMLPGDTNTDTWGVWTNGNYYFVAGDPVPEPLPAASQSPAWPSSPPRVASGVDKHPSLHTTSVV